MGAGSSDDGHIGGPVSCWWIAARVEQPVLVGPTQVLAEAIAIPLLKGADAADLVIYNANYESELLGERSGADMALYLARHGVKVAVTEREAPMMPANPCWRMPPTAAPT